MRWAERFLGQSDNQTQEQNARIFHRVFTIAQYSNRHLPGLPITLEIFDAV